MRDEITKLIHAYGDAFRLGPSAIAEFYWEPCVTVRMGVVRVNETRQDTERLFAEVDASYRARGFTYGEPLAIDVQPLGANSALATVQWAYNGACAELLWKTTFSYNLHRRDGAWKILVQTMHDS
jgi:hypothetical protein